MLSDRARQLPFGRITRQHHAEAMRFERPRHHGETLDGPTPLRHTGTGMDTHIAAWSKLAGAINGVQTFVISGTERKLKVFPAGRDTEEFEQRQQSAKFQAVLWPGHKPFGIRTIAALCVEARSQAGAEQAAQGVGDCPAAVKLESQVKLFRLDRT